LSADRAAPRADARGLEAQRQRALLALLWGEPDAARPVFAGPAAACERGLAAYRGNAAALAPRALAAAFPTVAQLMGGESFAALARAHWLRDPPTRGDLAWWGERLPEALAQDSQLADEPYLADVARLDWAVHRAGFAADDPGPPQGLALLAEIDPARALLRLRAGTAVVASRHAIVEIWRAHHRPVPPDENEARAGDGDERFAAARRALLAGRAQAAWVTRAGGAAVRVLELGDADARFTAALLSEVRLDEALRIAGASFDFEAWLILALREGALSAVQVAPPPDAAR
jgi:hypothetical protein